jgi:hypothetical protein
MKLGSLGPWVNVGLFVALIGSAAWLMWWQNNRLDAGAVATLVGALIGGAAVLLGNALPPSMIGQKSAGARGATPGPEGAHHRGACEHCGRFAERQALARCSAHSG